MILLFKKNMLNYKLSRLTYILYIYVSDTFKDEIKV